MSSIAATFTSSARTWLSPMTRSRANWNRVILKSTIRILMVPFGPGHPSKASAHSQLVAASCFAIAEHLVRGDRIGELLGIRDVQCIGSDREDLRDVVGEARVQLAVGGKVQRQTVAAVGEPQELVAPGPGHARLQSVLLVEAHGAVGILGKTLQAV